MFCFVTQSHLFHFPNLWIGQFNRWKIDHKQKRVGFLVWMSGSLRLIHPLPLHLILHSAFNSIHLLSVSAAKSVLLLLHNMVPCQDWKVLSTTQTLNNTNRPPPFSYMEAIFRPCAIHAFLFVWEFCGWHTLQFNHSVSPPRFIVHCSWFFCAYFLLLQQSVYFGFFFRWRCIWNVIFLYVFTHPCFFPYPPISLLSFFQVMETKNMLYLVTEYAKNGEIFGEFFSFFSIRLVIF